MGVGQHREPAARWVEIGIENQRLRRRIGVDERLDAEAQRPVERLHIVERLDRDRDEARLEDADDALDRRAELLAVLFRGEISAGEVRDAVLDGGLGELAQIRWPAAAPVPGVEQRLEITPHGIAQIAQMLAAR